MRKQTGFTLIELMIVIAILGLLTVVALPAYRNSVLKANRADAHISMSRLATLQERHFFRTNAYTDDFADLVAGASTGDPIDSDEGWYSIALVSDGTSWSMTATAQGAQADDVECASLTLDNVGRKTAKKSDNSASGECW